MKNQKSSSARNISIGFVAIATLISTLSGCGGTEEKREYTVPDTLCGIPVDSKYFAPLFPVGQKIAVTEKNYSSTKGCNIAVDGKSFATTTQAWLEAGRTTAYFAASLSLGPPKQSTEEERYRFAAREAFGKTQACVDIQHKQELYTAVQIWDKKYKDADAMKHLIISFTKEVEKSAECTAGTQG